MATFSALAECLLACPRIGGKRLNRKRVASGAYRDLVWYWRDLRPPRRPNGLRFLQQSSRDCDSYRSFEPPTPDSMSQTDGYPKQCH
eukprot:3075873-Lingulodinium_polyedra.AAC.1